MSDKKIAGACPSCASSNSVLESTDFTGGCYYDTLNCEDCGAKWKETFSFSTFSIIPKKEEASGSSS